MNFLKCRFGERSTYAHLVTCLTAVAAVAFGLPWFLIWGLIGISLVGAFMPDGSVKPK